MKDIRRDTITDGLVIYSSSRNNRPHDKSNKTEEKVEEDKFVGIYSQECPFCPGNEDQNVELDRVESDGQWMARAVENKFPILDNSTENIYGNHEVIIESRYHDADYYNMNIDDFKNIYALYIRRHKELSKGDGIKYVNIFKNSGASAGASLDHTHSQIISLNILPPEIAKELELAEKHYKNRSSNLYDDIIFSELNYKRRVIHDGEYFLMYVPYASRYSGEVRIIAKDKKAFVSWSDKEIEELAYMYDRFFNKWEDYQGKIPFNVIVHTNPIGDEKNDVYRTHIHIVPRKFNFGGFELSTNLFVCSVDPEILAQELKFN